jgi:hypothetical protein
LLLYNTFFSDPLYYGLAIDKGLDFECLFEFELVLWMFYRVWSNSDEKQKKYYQDLVKSFTSHVEYEESFWDRFQNL